MKRGEKRDTRVDCIREAHHNSFTNCQVCEVQGFANQRSLETGESLNRISIVSVPDPFFPPHTKEKSGLAPRDYRVVMTLLH